MDNILADSVSVIIPSYGREESILRCVNSVVLSDREAIANLEIVIVSSGYDQSLYSELARVVVSYGHSFCHIDPGFIQSTSRSRNLGAEASSSEYLYFLDDDNTVASNTITGLYQSLVKWEDACMVAPVMFYGDAPDTIWCAGGYRTKLLMRTIFRREIPTPIPERLESDDFPNCFMVRRREFNAIGGFDEDQFPQMFEESDLAKRLKYLTGCRSFCVPEYSVWHHMSMARYRRYHVDSPEKAFLMARQRIRFLNMYGSQTQKWVARLGGNWLYLLYYSLIICSAPRKTRWTIWRAYLLGTLKSGQLK